MSSSFSFLLLLLSLLSFFFLFFFFFFNFFTSSSLIAYNSYWATTHSSLPSLQLPTHVYIIMLPQSSNSSFESGFVDSNSNTFSVICSSRLRGLPQYLHWCLGFKGKLLQGMGWLVQSITGPLISAMTFLYSSNLSSLPSLGCSLIMFLKFSSISSISPSSIISGLILDSNSFSSSSCSFSSYFSTSSSIICSSSSSLLALATILLSDFMGRISVSISQLFSLTFLKLSFIDFDLVKSWSEGDCCLMHLNSLKHRQQQTKQRIRWQQKSAFKGQQICPRKVRFVSGQFEHFSDYLLGSWSQKALPPKKETSGLISSRGSYAMNPVQMSSLKL